MPAASIKYVVKQGAGQIRQFVYEKPTLKRLGLLRLMTKWSHSGDDQGDQGGNNNNQGGNNNNQN